MAWQEGDRTSNDGLSSVGDKKSVSMAHWFKSPKAMGKKLSNVNVVVHGNNADSHRASQK
jgi:hypothetical protein